MGKRKYGNLRDQTSSFLLLFFCFTSTFSFDSFDYGSFVVAGDDLIGDGNMVWGRPTSEIPFSDSNKVSFG